MSFVLHSWGLGGGGREVRYFLIIQTQRARERGAFPVHRPKAVYWLDLGGVAVCARPIFRDFVWSTGAPGRRGVSMPQAA